MNPEQTAAFILWADLLTQCLGSCAEISLDRRMKLQSQMEAMAQTQGFRFDVQAQRYTPIEPPAPKPHKRPDL